MNSSFSFKTLRCLALCAGLIAAALPSMAQSAVDANSVQGSDVRGTARFVAMGGAFTSLGGDLSSLTQNPAGLGIYRRSEIGLTFDITAHHTTSATNTDKLSWNHTKADFDNFAYIGSINLPTGALRTFSWGVGYQRLQSFSRRFRGYNGSTQTSVSNYIANFTNGIAPEDIDFEYSGSQTTYNPYLDSTNDWLSILGYTTMMVNPTGQGNNTYNGLFQNGTVGDADYEVWESGYVDEYNIDFGGNVSDVFYWGLGVGIRSLNYNRSVYYSESMADAQVYDIPSGHTTSGNANIWMDHYKNINGTGANIKLGVIVRPIDEFRVGAAIHTPTWLHINHWGYTEAEYSYLLPDLTGKSREESGTNSTPDYDYNSRLNSPWRFMVGASYTIGSRAIVSADYERVQYADMTTKEPVSNRYGFSYETDEVTNTDIKEYFKGGDIFRLGIEFRVTPRFSVRAGFNTQSSHVRESAANGDVTIATTDVDPSFNFTNSTNNLSFGLGYRYKAWYIDMAYQWKHQTGTFHAYSNFNGKHAPTAELTQNDHGFFISTGLRF